MSISIKGCNKILEILEKRDLPGLYRVKMSWPLPCFSLNSEAGKVWLEEYLGPNSKSLDIGDGIKINSSFVMFEDMVYLTYENPEIGGPAQKFSNEQDKGGKASIKGQKN